MSISAWPARERPREKLQQLGPASLSDAELLALLLRTGVRGRSAVDLARELLGAYGSLGALLALKRGDPRIPRGVGMAKISQLHAVLELAKRALAETLSQGNALSTPAAVRDYLRLNLAAREHEVFMGVFLDAQNRVLASEELFRGTLTQTSVYAREVVKSALRRNAAAVVFAHNHPSGVCEPSQADLALTQALCQALALVDIRVLDHFIVAGGGALSFAERGLI